MSKKLLFITSLIIILFIIFVFSVKITENVNDAELMNDYTYQSENKGTKLIQKPAKKAIEYHRIIVNQWLIRLSLSFVIPLIFLTSGLSSGIRNWAFKRTSIVFFAFLIYFLIYSIITTALELPLNYYSTFTLKHIYGLSNQTFFKWTSDFLKSFIITTSAGSLFIYFVYMLMKRLPNSWWFYLGILMIPILAFVTFISPMYIDPLFNKYQKVQDVNLENKIHSELKRAGIENCNVYEVYKSADTNEMNAYMTGVLNSKRIVIWDTTIKKLTDRETLCVLAHEMGHYVMNHIWKSIVLGGILSIFIFYIVNKAAIFVINNSNFGFSQIHDTASLPLLIILLNLFVFIITPAINSYSRYTEFEADRFELELTKDNEAAVSSTIKLHQNSLILPSPGVVYKLWNYDHPTFEERVKFANDYKPWEYGEPLKYEKYINK
ncbi:M48 family metallopeptidase [Clostridium sp. JN-1]|uniref:M48 family metallopeptidase n=1 Tax=Clostridium sp. JN-1 TaxID=2483110 RepID=UPI000F0BAB07|nr:M48 family metallopeptidase [Clostridium sp. JN-1]